MGGGSVKNYLKCFGLGFFLLQANSAFAYCSEPDAPDPPASYSKPDVPYCLSEFAWSGEHSCDEWEVTNYFNEVDDYITKLKSYLEEVEHYQSEAYEYAQCMAEEVKSQHE